MDFASPIYAFLLFVLPFIALLKIWSDARAQKAVQAFASSDRLRPNLLGGVSMVWSGLHFGLQILGLAFVIIALTRPHVGFEEEDIPQSGRNIFIAIDTSKSMLADDMTPNRLTRAKLAALDLVEKLPGERIGLIAFAGRAFLQAPLTTDHDAVRESIDALDHTTIPRGGSSIAAAIELALKLVEKSPGQHHGMVLFSDGQETDEGTQKAAEGAAKNHLLVLPVGMGTTEGSLIPDPDPEHQGEYLRDEKRNVIRARLESALLKKVASITGTQYVELASQTMTREAVGSLLSQLDRQKADSRHEARPIERYQWPLGVGIFCIILSMLMRPSSRKIIKAPALPVDPQTAVHVPARVAAALVILLLTFGAPSQAATIADAKKAQESYEKGQYDEARKAYEELLKSKNPPASPEELAYGLGAAAHQLKDYESSIHAFSDSLQSHNADAQKRAYKGLAAALYNKGDLSLEKKPEVTIKSWTDAREHFDSALKLFSANKDMKEYREIKENRDFVQKRLDELKRKLEQKKQEQEKNKQQQKQKGDGKGQGDPKDSEDENPPQKNEDKEEQDQKQKDGKQDEHDAMQKPEDKLPEGQLRADDTGKKPEPKEADDNERNDKTGFSPQEARNQLRSYADDQKFNQKSWQYMQRREKPVGGKDY